VAVIGPLADDAKSALGNWWGAGRPEDAVTPLAGLRRALPNARITYARGAPADTADTSGFAQAVAAARAADAVVLVLGERQDMSAEASSRASVELPGVQLALAQAVVRAARAADPRRPVVAVLMNGRPLATPWLADSVPALVESWFLGVEHGTALADVLLGDANPSGRMPVTVPRATGQIPLYYNHKNTGRPAAAGNHYTSKYIDLPWTPLYPFGHGRSYTTFAYANLAVPAEVRMGDSVVVSVEVANTGARAGDEVAQLYVRDDAASVTRPGARAQGVPPRHARAGRAAHGALHAPPGAAGLPRRGPAQGGRAGDVHGVGRRQLGGHARRALSRGRRHARGGPGAAAVPVAARPVRGRQGVSCFAPRPSALHCPGRGRMTEASAFRHPRPRPPPPRRAVKRPPGAVETPAAPRRPSGPFSAPRRRARPPRLSRPSPRHARGDAARGAGGRLGRRMVGRMAGRRAGAVRRGARHAARCRGLRRGGA
jgi:hypothetical protein